MIASCVGQLELGDRGRPAVESRGAIRCHVTESEPESRIPFLPIHPVEALVPAIVTIRRTSLVLLPLVCVLACCDRPSAPGTAAGITDPEGERQNVPAAVFCKH